MAGKRSKGERGDEPLSRFRHHHVDIERLALQGTYKLRRFIGSDAPRNTNRNLHSDDCNSGFPVETRSLGDLHTTLLRRAAHVGVASSAK